MPVKFTESISNIKVEVHKASVCDLKEQDGIVCHKLPVEVGWIHMPFRFWPCGHFTEQKPDNFGRHSSKLQQNPMESVQIGCSYEECGQRIVQNASFLAILGNNIAGV